MNMKNCHITLHNETLYNDAVICLLHTYVHQCSKDMQHILRLARRDGDEWVRVLACILAPFPTSQSITLEQCPEASLEDTLGEIANALTENPQHFVPQQYAYLNAAVLHSTYNYQPVNSHDHFVLKKQPHASLQLRSDILQRAGTDFSQTGSLVKDRHQLQRQSSLTVPTNPFVSTMRSAPTRKVVPIPGGSVRVQRERGTKLLDIDEVPIANKRKRKMTNDGETASGTSRTDVKKAPQKPSTKVEGEIVPPPSTPTPDYVAALGSEYGTVPASRPLSYPDQSSSYNPQDVPMDTALTPLKTQDVLTQPAAHTSAGAEPSVSTGGAPGVAKQPTKGLRLTRQQLAIAQEMFKESPTLSREERTLIIGFMAGSRENPYPDHQVVTIKLNEKHETEEVTTPTGTVSTRKVLLETVFEMDYSTGRWRKLQYKKTLPQEVSI